MSLHSLQSKLVPRPYSSVLRTASKHNVLIVKPVNIDQSTLDTCKQLEQVINPAALSIKVKNIIPKKMLFNCQL